jgi:hypothetical protein
LKTRVRIKETRSGAGKLEIVFNGEEDLKRILALLIKGRKE